MPHHIDYAHTEAHPDAQDYILRLVVECRRYLADGHQPIIYRMLDGLKAHRDSLQSCGEPVSLYGHNFVRELPETWGHKHDALIILLSDLSIQLKLIRIKKGGNVTETLLSGIEREALKLSECKTLAELERQYQNEARKRLRTEDSEG